jgi:hypothetical protein
MVAPVDNGMISKKAEPPKPNFLIVGAARCGTTSLRGYLRQHPDIYIPEKKECRYFSNIKNKYLANEYDRSMNRTYIDNRKEYMQLFEKAHRAKAIGDVSPDYLYNHEESVPRILEELGPDVKIIIALRDPRCRAFSHYMHHAKSFVTPDGSFEEALENEAKREGTWAWYWQYRKAGLYAGQVGAYLKNFASVKIVVFESFLENRLEGLAELFEYLKVRSDTNVSLNVNPNSSRELRTKLGHRNVLKLMKRVYRISDRRLVRLAEFLFYKKEKRTLSTKTKQELTRYYKADVARLEKLTGMSLHAWLG